MPIDTASGAELLERAEPNLGRTAQRDFTDLVKRIFQKVTPKVDPQTATTALADLFLNSIVVATGSFAPLIDGPRLQALVRGISARNTMLHSHGGPVSAANAANLLTKSKTQILDDYKHGRILGVRIEKQNAVLFPVWQIEADRHRVRPAVVEALKVMAEVPQIDDWAKLTFFMAPRDSLGGKAPVDLLENNPERVVKLARAYAD